MPSKRKTGPSIGDAAVEAATGKNRARWFSILDRAGCRSMNHRQIVACLARRCAVGSWWQQMITVAYEQARGLREKHEKPDGFQISRSTTLPVGAGRAFAAWADVRTRRRWLADPGFTMRKSTRNRSLRISWVDGKTSVEVMFYSKGRGKTQVVVQHNKLPSARVGDKMKAYWGRQLELLAGLVSPAAG